MFYPSVPPPVLIVCLEHHRFRHWATLKPRIPLPKKYWTIHTQQMAVSWGNGFLRRPLITSMIHRHVLNVIHHVYTKTVFVVQTLNCVPLPKNSANRHYSVILHWPVVKVPVSKNYWVYIHGHRPVRQSVVACHL